MNINSQRMMKLLAYIVWVDPCFYPLISGNHAFGLTGHQGLAPTSVFQNIRIFYNANGLFGDCRDRSRPVLLTKKNIND